MSKHIAVLWGGFCEKEVSKTTAEAVTSSLTRLGYRISQVEYGSDIAKELNELKPDVVFNAMHGTIGEDGVIVGLLKCLNIPYTHSGLEASAIGMNKQLTKIILQHYGLRFPEGQLYSKDALLQEPKLTYPCVIKPNDNGSSVDVYIVQSEQEFPKESLANSVADSFLVEEYIPGKEISTAVFNDKAVGVLELQPISSEFFDYKSKYTEGQTKHIMPAEIPSIIYGEAMQAAETAHKTLGCRHISRFDFRYDNQNTGHLYCLEINTHPGLTPLSILPEILDHSGVSYDDMIQSLVENAQCEK